MKDLRLCFFPFLSRPIQQTTHKYSPKKERSLSRRHVHNNKAGFRSLFHFLTTYLSCIGGCWLIRLLGYSECFGINSSWLLSLPFKSKTVSRLENNVSAGEPCCTLNILSSKLSGSSLGCFFSFAPGCLE